MPATCSVLLLLHRVLCSGDDAYSSAAEPPCNSNKHACAKADGTPTQRPTESSRLGGAADCMQWFITMHAAELRS